MRPLVATDAPMAARRALANHGRAVERLILIGWPLLLLLIFAPAIGHFFHQDDFGLLLRAQQVSGERLLGYFQPPRAGFYRPLVELYFAAQVRLIGLWPAGFQLTSLALLTLNGWLIVGLGRRLGLNRVGGLAAGLFYSGHAAFLPLILWPATTGSLLMVTALLLTVWLWWRAATGRQRLLALLPFGLALTARETAVIIPGLLWLGHWLSARPWHQGGRVAVGQVIVSLRQTSLAWLLLAAYLLFRTGGLVDLTSHSAYQVGLGPHLVVNLARLLGHATGLGVGLGLTLGPALDTAYRLLFWLLLVGGSLWLARQGTIVALLGLGWCALGLTPHIVLLRHSMDPYYLDAALIGVALAVGALVERAIGASARRWRPLVGGGLLLTFLTISSASVRLEIERSPAASKALAAQQLLADLAAIWPERPRGARLYLVDIDPASAAIIDHGDLFRAMAGDPTLQTWLVDQDALPAAARPMDSAMLLTIRAGRLIEFRPNQAHSLPRSPIAGG